MKDRFKFRIWDKIDKRFMSGSIFIDCRKGCMTGNMPEDKYVIQQCTGLKDKNGKLIYEGDLLRYPAKNKYEQENYACLEVFFHDNDCCDNHIGFQLGRVHFHGCLCGGSFGNGYKFIPKNANKMEIIGNVFENKELLESRNERERTCNN